MRIIGKILFFIKALNYTIRGKEKKLSVSIPSISDMLKGKTILVTGGSSGYGFSMAEQLIRQGARVIIVGRDIDRLTKASNRLGNESAIPLQWDVADFDCVEDKIAEAEKNSGKPIDAFINNAGITIIGPTHFIESDWDKIFAVNTYAIEVLNNAQYRYLKSKGGGKIINITSNANIISEFHPYYLSKSDALGITIRMAKNSLGDNIYVNSIAPGIAVTNINPALKSKIGKSGNFYCSATLNKRYTLVEDVANLALFLISDKGNGLNGQNIVVDGGMSLI